MTDIRFILKIKVPSGSDELKVHFGRGSPLPHIAASCPAYKMKRGTFMRLEGSFFWVFMRSYFAMIQLMLSNGEKKINNKKNLKSVHMD